MNTELLMQYVTFALIAIGALAFLVSVITQVIKEMPGLNNIQTNAVALIISLILCPLAAVILCIYLQIVIAWYYIVAAGIAVFFVCLFAKRGWGEVFGVWEREKKKKQNKTG